MKAILIFSILCFSKLSFALEPIYAVQDDIQPLNIPEDQIVNYIPIAAEKVQSAQMTILNTNDENVADNYELVELQDAQQKKYHFLVDGRVVAFSNPKVIPLGCGTNKIIAKNVANEESMEMILIDHTKRSCKDLQRFKWVVSVKNRLPSIETNYELVGNPHP